MKHIQRLLAAIVAAICCLFIVRYAHATAPPGGYRIVETRKDVVVLEIGEGTTYRMLKSNFGKQFRESTGKELDDFEALQALNPKTTIPVCWPPGDGPMYRGSGHTEVWATCKSEHKTLWLIAGPGGYIEIPIVKKTVETYAEWKLRHESMDACEDASCVAKYVKNPKAASGLGKTLAPQPVPVAVTSPSGNGTELAFANAKVADLERKLAEANKKLETPAAPATIAPAKTQTSSWGWLVLWLGSCGTLLLFGYLYAVRPRDRRISALHEDYNALDLEKATVEANAKRARKDMRSEVVLYAQGIGVPVVEKDSFTDIVAALKERSDVLMKAHKCDADVIADLTRRMIDLAAQLGVKLPDGAGLTQIYAAIATHLVDISKQLKLSRDKLEDISKEKQRYGELEDQLKPSIQRLIEIDNQRTDLVPKLARLEQKIKANPDAPPEARQQAEQAVVTLRNALRTFESQSDHVLAHIAPIHSEYDQIKQRLTGRSDTVLDHYKEAQRDRNDAAADRAAAAMDRAAATAALQEVASLKSEAAQELARAQTLASDAATRHKDLDARQAFVEDREYQAGLREGDVRQVWDANMHLLGDALKLLGYEPEKMQIVDVLALDGVRGIQFEFQKGFEQVSMINSKLGKELEQAREDLERVRSELDGQRRDGFHVEQLAETNAELEMRLTRAERALAEREGKWMGTIFREREAQSFRELELKGEVATLRSQLDVLNTQPAYAPTNLPPPAEERTNGLSAAHRMGAIDPIAHLAGRAARGDDGQGEPALSSTGEVLSVVGQAPNSTPDFERTQDFERNEAGEVVRVASYVNPLQAKKLAEWLGEFASGDRGKVFRVTPDTYWQFLAFLKVRVEIMEAVFMRADGTMSEQYKDPSIQKLLKKASFGSMLIIANKTDTLSPPAKRTLPPAFSRDPRH